MISSSGSVNIPVEDKSYKWSKKIFKTRIPQGKAVIGNNCPELY
jgi:hypothetical protein